MAMPKKPRPKSQIRSGKPKRLSPLAEIDAFFRRSGIMIRALTVKDILEEQIAKKLA